MAPSEQEGSAKIFLDLIRKSRRGKFKVYVGMSAGVGKTFRMLQEGHALLRSGIDLHIGYIETHNRSETHALVGGIPLIARRKLFYKGKELEEMDVNAILNLHPEVVIVDELAHTNAEGSKNGKRWQDVVDILEAGISVISAVNIQHLESINEEVERIAGVPVNERIPDKILELADEIVNIDLTADELIDRLKAGKIYDESKIGQALNNFFRPERILQLRELALKEVAHHLERKISTAFPKQIKLRPEKLMACISSNAEAARLIIRKTARLASYYKCTWLVLYVQRDQEGGERIRLDLQRHLINNLKLATELGAEVLKVKGEDVTQTIERIAAEKEVTAICIGKPHLSLFQVILRTAIFGKLLKQVSKMDIDIMIFS